MAIKLFGSATAAIGQKLKEVADDLYGWEAKKVVAVVKIPSKCHIYLIYSVTLIILQKHMVSIVTLSVRISMSTSR